jgi:hypothetical protein
MSLKQHTAALHWAKSQIGQHEVPMGSNTGPFVFSCQSSTWLGGTHWPWCIAFIQKAWQEAGRKLPWLGAGAYAMLDWARKEGWDRTVGHCVPGDICIWNIGAGHGSLLEFYDRDTGMVTTVDGNVSDAVGRHIRPQRLLRGCIHIPEVDTKPPAKPPLFEVATGASGHAMVVWSGTRKGLLGAMARLIAKYPGGFTIRRRKR